MELTIEQAMQNVKQALETFVGTKKDHVILQESINLIEEKINEGLVK